MSPVCFLRRSSHLFAAIGTGLVAVVATLALAPPRVRLADARVTDVLDLASPASTAPVAGITRVDATHVTIARAAIDRALADPVRVIGTPRLVWSSVRGQTVGFKLYAIRPGSPLAALGLANGDTLRAINGLPLTSTDHALAAYTRLRSVDHFALELTRRGQPLTLTYEIVD